MIEARLLLLVGVAVGIAMGHSEHHLRDLEHPPVARGGDIAIKQHECVSGLAAKMPGFGANAQSIPTMDDHAQHDATERKMAAQQSSYMGFHFFLPDDAVCLENKQRVDGLEGSAKTNARPSRPTTYSCGVCLGQDQYVSLFLYTSVQACTSEDVMTDAKYTYARALVEEAMSQINSTIAINTALSEASTRITLTSCGSSPGVPLNLDGIKKFVSYTDAITRPYNALTAGAGYFMVTFAPPYTSTSGDATTTPPTSDSLAWASTCVVDSSSRRMLAAQLNINPRALINVAGLDSSVGSGVVYKNQMQYLSDVNAVMHAILHALGFQRTALQTPRGAYNAQTNSWDGRQYFLTRSGITQLSSPRVKDAASAYYGCNDATWASSGYAEIENVASDSDSDMHWEARVALDDIMSGRAMTANRYLSNLTVSLLLDTGHYVIANGATTSLLNLDRAKSFGRNRGCSFLTARCNANFTANQPTHGYCFNTPDDNATDFCTADGLGRGYCNAITRTSFLSSTYRYYTDGRAGGAFPEPDYCPIVVPYQDRSCVDRANADTFNVYGSAYGPASRCFRSTAAVAGFSSGFTTRCFTRTCTAAGANSWTLTVQVGNIAVTCPVHGGDVDLSALSSTFTGVLTCPPASEMCAGAAGTASDEAYVVNTRRYGVNAGRTRLPVLDGITAKAPGEIPLDNHFVRETACNTRMRDCFIPALDAYWPSGACDAIARKFTECFMADCPREGASLLKQRFVSAVDQRGVSRSIPMFLANCSNTVASTSCVFTSSSTGSNATTARAAGSYSYCKLASAPSSAVALISGTAVVMTQIIVVMLVLAILA